MRSTSLTCAQRVAQRARGRWPSSARSPRGAASRRARSRSGCVSQWRSARLPMPVRQLSSSDSSVGASSPRSVCVSSRLRCVAGGSSSSSPARSHLEPAHVAPAPGPGCARHSSAARRRRRAPARRSCASKPASEATCSCSHSLRWPSAASNCQAGRARAARRRCACTRRRAAPRRRPGPRPAPAAPASAASSRSLHSARPSSAAGQRPARPGRSGPRAARAAPAAACRLASASSSLSVTVPGVTTRTTLRSTGPLAVADVAHLLGDRHRLAQLDQPRQVGSRPNAPARRPSPPARRPTGAARGQRDVEQPVRLARVVEEQLVEVAHPVEHAACPGYSALMRRYCCIIGVCADRLARAVHRPR